MGMRGMMSSRACMSVHANRSFRVHRSQVDMRVGGFGLVRLERRRCFRKLRERLEVYFFPAFHALVDRWTVCVSPWLIIPLLLFCCCLFARAVVFVAFMCYCWILNVGLRSSWFLISVIRLLFLVPLLLLVLLALVCRSA